jgi:AcrR family transcriptional regulator
MRKRDRRVQRTRKLLRDSLVALSLEKGYDAVTIQDITDHANLGRATFYLHYRDKDDLLLSTLQALVDDLLSKIEPDLERVFAEGDVAPIRVIFQHAKAHRDLYRIMLRGQGGASVERQLREYTATNSQRYLNAVLQARPSPIPVEIAANHLASSLLGVLHWWLDNDMPYSAGYMACAFFELGVTGIFKTLGLENHDQPGAPDCA